MEPSQLFARLAEAPATMCSLVAGVSDVQWRWKPETQSWSLLEVICHLADEEVEDFRARLDRTLHRPGQPWPPTDPMGWVTSRGYNRQDPTDELVRFVEARAESVRWLRSLEAPDWAAETIVPWGVMRAGDVLAAWAAHDLLHTRQLVELRWAWLTAFEVDPYSAGYAGGW